MSTFVSFAQNLEDVVLWRALSHVERGNYIDVGAAHPVIDSVSAAFFERGWRGVHIEPEPTYAALLRSARPTDHVIEAAAGSAEGTATLRVVPATGWSSLDDGVKTELEAGDMPFHDVQVSVLTIDAILTELGFEDRPIHFMKVDTEGHELAALQGANLRKWKPWVLVIEATAQNRTRQTHHEWEPVVTDAGYSFCLFDGLNRFYVNEEHTELTESLSYPSCTFDEPLIRWRDQQHIARLSDRLAEMTQQSANLQAELVAMTNTLSWRITRPLRFVRRG